MAGLQKFKILATQCGVAPSPTRSPRSSPLLQLTQKTTLRMLLTRRRNSTGDRDLFVGGSAEMLMLPCENKKKIKKKDRQKLKDLFGSSSSEEAELENKEATADKDRPFILGGEEEECMKKSGVVINSSTLSHSGRQGFVGRFRYRALLKKSWRPPLHTIPE